MAYRIVEDHEKKILLVETWGSVSKQELAGFLKDIIQSDLVRENGKLLIDHSRLEKVDGSFQLNFSAVSSIRHLHCSAIEVRLAVIGSGDLLRGLGRQASTIFESLFEVPVDRRQFENKEAALTWLASGDG